MTTSPASSPITKWTKKEPEDIEALVRLGRTLAGMGRAAEVQAWYEKAIKLALTRRDLRLCADLPAQPETRSTPRPLSNNPRRLNQVR